MDDSINKFFTKYTPLRFKKGDTIIQAEDDPSGVYFLLEGHVKMNSIFENGSELTLNIFKPGTFFPMTWVIGDLKNTYFFQAMDNVSVYKAPKKEVVDFIRENPDILYDLTKRILIGMDGLIYNTQHLLFTGAKERVVTALLISAKRFGKTNGNGHITIDLRLTHQDIANMAGLTRETTSNVISQLEKEGYITQGKHEFTINDIEALNDLTYIVDHPTE
jgi:CRP-like cAMP-binding protein